MSILLNTKDLREKIAEQQAEAEAIVALAEAENRELTEDEQKAFDAIVGRGKKGDDDFLAGSVEKLRVDLGRAEKREELQANLLHKRVESGEFTIGNQGDDDDSGMGFACKVRVPARCRSRRKLTCFTGENGEREAFLTGHFLAAHFGGSRRSQQFLDDLGFENVMTEGDSAKGGIFVPVETEMAIIRLVENYGVIRRNTTVTPMSSDRKVKVVRVEGITAHPVGEREEGTHDDPSYKSIELIARKWKVITKMSEDLNEDTLVDMAEEFTMESALAFAYAEDNSCFNGDGTSAFHKITGILNALNAGSILTASANTFGGLAQTDFNTLVGMLPDYPGIQPAWYISKPAYYASMARLELAAGGNTTSEIREGANELMFMGYPVRWSHVLNKTLTAQASKKIVLFGDLRMGTLFGDRRGITMSMTEERYWETDEIGLKGTERFDFNCHSKGTSTEAGAIVALETPS